MRTGEGIPSIVGEFGVAALGNQLRNQRLNLCVKRISRAPGDSFPEQFADEAELEGLYRFVNSDEFTDADVLEPHIIQTAARAAATRTPTIVSHDTTEFEFRGEFIARFAPERTIAGYCRSVRNDDVD
jgi:hypothetical protein